MDRRAAASHGDYDEQGRVKGTEVFVGGLPRSATEGTLREVFSPCGEIVDLRIMKDQNGVSKGFGFVRFAERECAYTAKRQKNGIELQGKRLAVDLSLDQDTLFFGNLCKEWSVEEFEELIHKTFKDVISVDLATASNLDSSTSKRRLNRGFAFVRFSSHGAAARVLRIGSRTDFLLGGVLHPAINWAERESNVDAGEMAKIKTAFVGNLPANVNEDYLKKLFGRFGEVVRVAVSRKGEYPVGFIHFGSRSELDNAIKEMDGKTVSGPDRGPAFKIQVADVTDPYEAAIMSLPSAVNELLRRILRLGIGTPYDIDIHCIKSLNELPESGAVAVLNQFLITGADKRNKGEYFASLVAKRKVEAFGVAQILHDSTYLSRNPEIETKRHRHQDYDYTSSRSSRYSSLGDYPSASYADDPPIVSQSRKYAEERPSVVRCPELRLRQDEIAHEPRQNTTKRHLDRRYAQEQSYIGTSTHEPRQNTGSHLDRRYIQEKSYIERSAHEPRQNTGRHLDRRYTQEQSYIERPAEAVFPRERRLLSAAGYTTDIGREFSSRSSAEYSTEHQQMRFDPFTGEPYKFDPFTGEPIRPEPNPRRSGSLYSPDRLKPHIGCGR
ncbi:splicing factor, proline- and glutamine-rich isoform X2 [Brachypodium distachyon]|uniref:RRM domain-containing protein n=1 Tax=Brachypodium distachyon TaxID=15368 RepID=A0A0Q3L1D6_BRADI|nr:splicing factor, proline- and glutamine-rich isoform X2 [Brachypodium distachyon]KQJ86173.1 hypothetical protein BRADI_4g03736v3 [Brachypodium distachyon]|eukprot:XP_010237119.1 splicing factor, proline- and glutamine-rich isoform X2 [Brachypodium distachyon]